MHTQAHAKVERAPSTAKVLLALRQRSASGNMIAIVAAAMVLITVTCLPTLMYLTKTSMIRREQQVSLEAASLAAARDLEKIVVNDPHFGYIALSDYPPIGKATLAADGEPLPVTGINTILGTARLETIIAENLGNPEMEYLAQQDVEAAHAAAKLLQERLNASLVPGNTTPTIDLDGNTVSPYEDALKIYMAGRTISKDKQGGKLRDFRLSLGWLRDGASTRTTLPQPLDLGQVPEKARLKGCYRSFVDIPAGGQSFYFAGVSDQPALADASRFVKADGKRFCSVVRAESEVTFNYSDTFLGGSSKIYSAACALPSALADACTPGAMVLWLPDGPPAGIKSIGDIFNDPQLNSNMATLKMASGGDFPNDPSAKLVADGHMCTVAACFSHGFYDWLRTAHCQPRIDSVLQAVGACFRDEARVGSGSQPYPMFAYEFDRYGNVVVINHGAVPFLAQTVYDRQNYGISFDAMNTGSLTWTMTCCDQVSRLGTECGGKHAGQSMPGDPVNWCDLPLFDGSPDQAMMMKKGSSRGVVPQGAATAGGGILLDSAYFTKVSRGDLSHQPRKNYYAGGLAVAFQLTNVDSSQK
jgi:hypothetical protein